MYLKTPYKFAFELMHRQKSYLEKTEVHFIVDKLYQCWKAFSITHYLFYSILSTQICISTDLTLRKIAVWLLTVLTVDS